MRNVVTPQEFYPAIQVVLGLPDHCVSFELRAAAGQCGVTVTCEHYIALDAPGLKKLESVLSEYELVRKSAASFYDRLFAGAESDLAAEIGFDAWMRRRIDRAHDEFMARTTRLPA